VKRRWLLAGCGIVLSLAVQMTATANPGPEELVEAEHRFARDVAQHGIRAGFLTHLASTAVVFAPGPVNARKHYTARPANAARLSWEPAVAVMSGAGDLGWTTGPWEWRSDSSRKAPQATGSFVTLWRRQPDSTFLAVLDLGVPHDPAPGGTAVLESRTLTSVPGARGSLAARRGLWKADADFAATASAQGLAAALAAHGAPLVRALRDGALPIAGRDAVRDTAAARHPRGRMMSLAQFISDSGDLGYTYGTFVEGSASAPDSSYYLHVWERAPGRPWQLALELFSAVPRGKQ
jgi:hypothetical protein